MDGYRLSPQQEHLWQLHSAGTGGLYAQASLTLPAGVDRLALRRAVETVCGRHEILRTTLRQPAGVQLPLQVIVDGPLLEFGERTVSEDGWARLRAARGGTVADLRDGPLVRADLADVDGRARLLLTVPATCADTPSLVRLAGEVGRAYRSGEATTDILQYADVAEWQYDLLTAAETAPGRQFWATRTGAPAIDLPFSRDAPPGLAFAPEQVHRPLPGDAGHGVTDVVLTAWRVLLGLVTDGDLEVSVETDNRRHDDLRDAVGPLRLTLPMAAGLRPDMTFGDAATAVAAATADLVRWQECHDPRHPTAVPPGAAFTWDDLGEIDPVAGWRLDDAVSYTEPFVVRLRGVCRPSATTLCLDFDSARMSRADAVVLLDMLCALLDHAITSPGTTLRDLARGLGRTFAATPAAAEPARPGGPTVLEAVRAMADAHPDGPAVCDATTSMTYRELHRRSTALAVVLRLHGVGRGTPVAVLVERTADTVVGFLGVAAAGGCFVPLDASLPPARIAALCKQIACERAVGPARLIRLLPAGMTTVCPDDVQEPTPGAATPPPVGPADLAYIIFTSGSTGTPKPVAVTHGNVAAYAKSMIDRIGLRTGDRCASPAALSADLGFTALFPPLYAGAAVHLMPAADAVDPAAFGRWMRAHAVDHLKVTPSHLRALLDGDDAAGVLPRRWLVLGGESCDRDLVRRVRDLAPDCRILNHYGPTETTVGVLTFEADGEPDTSAVPIGQPLPHATVRLLDDTGAPVAPWVPGEICIGGAGVARGYLGQPGETARRFVPDEGGRLYRTGDRGRWLGDATVMFLGRRDGQVKIRGFRVEVGEVEAVLRTVPGVSEAAVLVRRDATGTATLAAYVVPGGLVIAGDLGTELGRRLPDHMVPASIAVVDALPRTANGKIDRRALATLVVATHQDAYVPPQGPIEETLATVFAAVLNLDKVGRDDNFFAIGGDSILSIRAVARAGRAGVRFSPPLLFQHQSVAALARAIEDGAARPVSAEQNPVHGSLPLTPVQRWFFDQHLPRPGHYGQVVVLRAARRLDPEPLERACRALLTHHDALRLRVTGDLRHAPRLALAPPDALPHRLTEHAGPGEVVRDAVQAVFENMALDSGRLLRVLHVAGPDGDRLVLVAHHLVVDAVSWPLLIEDLADSYLQAERGGTIALPAKSTDVGTVARRLNEYANTPEAREHLDLWTQIVADGAVAGLRRPTSGPATNTYGRARTVSATSTVETTRALLNPARPGADAHLVLLTALGRALAAFTGRPRVAVDVEGHGRNLPWADVDVTRTAGWFTTIYPLAWDARADDDADALARVARAAARVTDGGVAFSVLRHLRHAADTEVLRRSDGPAVRFNYLGRVDTAGEDGLFTVTAEPTGPAADPGANRPYLLDVTASVAGNRLTVTITFCPDVHREDDIRRISDDLDAAITRLVTRTDAGPAPDGPDFTESGLSDDELAGLMDSLDLTVGDDA